MKKMICMLGLVALTSCSHFGGSCCAMKKEQCNMHQKEKCAKCGDETCAKCDKDHSQCPMDKAAPAPATTPVKK